MKTLLLALLLTTLALPAFAADKGKETAYDRVMKTQTIRCGWGTNNPWIYQDLQTGEMQGVIIEIMQNIAAELHFKLEWPEETGWNDLPIALESGRVDVACSTLWRDPARAKYVAYTRPVFYTPIYAYARAGDSRFTGKREEIDDPAVRIVVQEGDIQAALAGRYFPHAQTLSLPPSSAWSDSYMSVTTKKADVVFADPIGIANFNAHQDAHLERIPLAEPITVYGNSFAVGIHEPALKEVLDATVSYMIDTGRIDDLTADFLKRYPGALIPVRKETR